MLKIQNVIKNYGMRNVLNGIDLTIDSGEVYGLVGANGAGKTTLMNIIARIINADSGEIYIDDKKIESSDDMKNKVGYILDIPALYDFMTAHEYFNYLAAINNVPKDKAEKREQKLLGLVGLRDVDNKLLKAYSRGMRQRFGIAIGLYNNPDIVIFDEPTSALDPIGRYEISEIIRALKDSGKTILLSTHILSDVEKICDRIGILAGGKIKKEGKINDVLKEYYKPYYEIIPSKDVIKLYDILGKKSYIKRIKLDNGIIKVEIDDTDEKKLLLLRDIADSGVPVMKFENSQPSLEKIFIMEAMSV